MPLPWMLFWIAAAALLVALAYGYFEKRKLSLSMREVAAQQKYLADQKKELIDLRFKVVARDAYLQEMWEFSEVFQNLLRAKNIRELQSEVRKALDRVLPAATPWELTIQEDYDPQKKPLLLRSEGWKSSAGMAVVDLVVGRVTIALSQESAELCDGTQCYVRLIQIAEAAMDAITLTKMAQTDPKTGLASHNHFRDILEVEVKKAARYATKLSLVMLDVDLFKGVNDKHGHQVGDEVICAVARILESHHRADIDTPARYGMGDEFLLLLPNTPLEIAAEVAELLRLDVEALRFIGKDDEEFGVTVSVGVATHTPEMGDIDALIATADVALYLAKEGGRNQVFVERRKSVRAVTQ